MSIIFACGLALLMSIRGLRKGSLSQSGAIAAFLVGSIALTSSSTIGLSLLVFYVAGSAVTRVGHAAKQKVDGEYRGAGGQRDMWQVFANAGVGTLVALVHMFTQDAIMRERLVISYIGISACCIGDTFASELGILANGDPWLITTWKRVPRGTNGGVSFHGTVASVAGGLLLAICLGTWNFMYHSIDILVIFKVCIWASLVGSVVDSALGATCQLSLLDSKSGKVFNRYPENIAAKDMRKICGTDWLSNNAVNLISSTLIGVFSAIAF